MENICPGGLKEVFNRKRTYFMVHYESKDKI
jgi:hypothetical protein